MIAVGGEPPPWRNRDVHSGPRPYEQDEEAATQAAGERDRPEVVTRPSAVATTAADNHGCTTAESRKPDGRAATGPPRAWRRASSSAVARRPFRAGHGRPSPALDGSDSSSTCRCRRRHLMAFRPRSARCGTAQQAGGRRLRAALAAVICVRKYEQTVAVVIRPSAGLLAHLPSIRRRTPLPALHVIGIPVMGAIVTYPLAIMATAVCGRGDGGRATERPGVGREGRDVNGGGRRPPADLEGSSSVRPAAARPGTCRPRPA